MFQQHEHQDTCHLLPNHHIVLQVLPLTNHQLAHQAHHPVMDPLHHHLSDLNRHGRNLLNQDQVMDLHQQEDQHLHLTDHQVRRNLALKRFLRSFVKTRIASNFWIVLTSYFCDPFFYI